MATRYKGNDGCAAIVLLIAVVCMIVGAFRWFGDEIKNNPSGAWTAGIILAIVIIWFVWALNKKRP